MPSSRSSVPPDGTARAIARAWPALVLLAPFATAYIVRVELWAHDATSGATLAVMRADAAEKAAVDVEKRVQERVCEIELAHVAALTRLVRLGAADAEPDKKRKAESASAAKKAFETASKDWACRQPNEPNAPHSAERLEALANSALEVSPR